MQDGNQLLHLELEIEGGVDAQPTAGSVHSIPCQLPELVKYLTNKEGGTVWSSFGGWRGGESDVW